MSQETLTLRHMLCPMPVINTQNKIKHLSPGDQLTVIATDPGTLNDIPAWCKINRHTVLSTEQKDQDIIFVIEVGEG